LSKPLTTNLGNYSAFHKYSEDDQGLVWEVGSKPDPQRPIVKHNPGINGWTKQLFQCLDVFGEGLAAGFSDAMAQLTPFREVG
jgi:hypothetical protein